jgi:hypothetical protein
LVHRSSVTPALPGRTPPSISAGREQWGSIVARFLSAVAVSATADVLWWLREPRHLTGPIDIVGYPTFANFDYIPSFAAYRLVTYAFPIGVLAVYGLLAWRGPLRRPTNTRRRRSTAQMLALPPAEPDLTAAEPSLARAEADVPAQAAVWPTLGVAARLLLPALVVAVAASARSNSNHQGITPPGLACGLVYLVGVPVLAAAITWVCVRPGPLRWAQLRSAIAPVNGIAGAMASVFGLWFISRHSVVVVLSDDRAQHWPWLPGWLAGLGMLVIAAWGVLRLRGGRIPAAVERRLLSVVVGAASVFLITSRLPGELGRFQGFDDAMNLVGARLLSKGYFPWRDFLFIHGLWTDALQGTVGFTVFGDTRWGSQAGTAVLLIPCVWVIAYLFAVWLSRENPLFLVGIGVVLLSGVLDSPPALLTFPDVRFIIVPVSLVLLGEMLRRRSFGWCAAFMIVLFSQAILVPETLFLVIPALLVVAAADLTHRAPGSGIWSALRKSCWCAAVGVGLILVWCAFLAVNHSLGPWIDYFKIFVSGHNAEGAVPPSNILPRYWIEFGLCSALVLVTFWAAAARVRGGRSWSPRDWVTVAAAGFVALYGEAALGRFDGPHIELVFIAAMPLILLWAERALTAADSLARAIASGTRSRDPRRAELAAGHPAAGHAARHPITLLAMAVAVVIAAPLAGAPSAFARAGSLPSQEHAVSVAEPTIPRLGYVVPGDADQSLLHDLGTALDTYAGKNGSVFDMTNSLGYIYYLLDRRPASRFVHVSMAITPYSQQLLIDSLRQSRPPVVIFDSVTIGVGEWDGIRNNVRHYEVSKYLLSNYQPVLYTHRVLLLLRNDLMATRPPIPRLIVPPVSTHLYFSRPPCHWGTVPKFLSSPPSGSSQEIPVTSLGPRVVTRMVGWAVDAAAQAPARMLVLASGRKVLRVVRPDVRRPDLVGAVGKYALDSGFSAAVIQQPGSAITVYGLAADGMLHLLAGQRSPLLSDTLTLPDGKVAGIGAPIRGHVDRVVSRTETIGVAQIPSGVIIADYDLLTLHASGPIGPSLVTISDAPGAAARHDIIARAQRSSGAALGVRVGSCLQWHGYPAGTLYVAQTGGAPITGFQLSGVGP